jgi:hypothetical protein
MCVYRMMTPVEEQEVVQTVTQLVVKVILQQL